MARVCDICGCKLPGKLGHGFVVDNGRMIVCSDYKRHNRIKKGQTYYYGQDFEPSEEPVES